MTVLFEVGPHDLLARAHSAVQRRTAPIETIVRTQFVDFDVLRGPIEHDPTGGFAVHGDTLLLLAGRVLTVVDDQTLEAREVRVEVPENGADALAARPYPSGDPIYLTNRWHRYNDIEAIGDTLFLSYSRYDAVADCFTSRVDALALDGPLADLVASAEDWEQVFESEPCLPFMEDHLGRPRYAGHMAAGRLAIGPDRALYVSVGDYGFDGIAGPALAQDPEATYGKVWRRDPGTTAWEVVSVGHRDPQGLAFTPDGRLWATEHGPQGGDELNLLLPGQNYGWPHVTYGVEYGASRGWPGAERQGRHEGYAQPVWAWVPSVAISALEVAQGVHPAWDGDLLAGSLRARSLFRIVIVGDDAVLVEPVSVGFRIRDLAVLGGRIFLYTDARAVLRLSPRS